MVFQQASLEKRVHSRIPVKLPVQYRLVDNPEPVEKFKGKVGLAKDLSLEGLFIKIAPDKSITLPEISKHLFAYGEVAWANRTGAGVHLMLMPEEDRQFLRAYLDMMDLP